MGEVLALANLVAFQLARIAPFWAAGILAGSLVSVFLSTAVSTAVVRMGSAKLGPVRLLFAVVLGAASPVCMYGTIPILAGLGRNGVPQHLLAAFMVSSILMNPNLFVFSFALGAPLAVIRLLACLAVAAAAGILVRALFRNVALFDFRIFGEKPAGGNGSRPTAGDYLRSLGRGIVRTAPYFLGGVLLTALMDRYFPRQWLDSLFHGNKGLGVILAASVGVPVYVCGGGTIPLVKYWLGAGMSPGSAVAFMVSGPATKLTNLGAVKIILGARNFGLYLAFCLVLAVLSGLAVDAVFGLAGWRIGP
jgi:uncharacterized membrane protein YraQ (UPF0718 family)